MQTSFEYQFEWDPIKAKKNLRKHGIGFERASTVFSDPRGLDRNGVLLVVCHIYQAEGDMSARVRIFSARKATKQETKQYEEL